MGRRRVLCIGAMLWDVIGRTDRPMPAGGDLPGRIQHLPGGVALNVAVAAARQGLFPVILSAVGQDAEGDTLIAATARHGVDCNFVTRDGPLPTDVYMAIEDPGGLIAAVADAHGLEAAGEAILTPLRDGTLAASGRPWPGPVVLDGNLTPAILATTLAEPALKNADLRLVPASPGKADRLRPLLDAPNTTACVNLYEAEILAGCSFADAASAAEALVRAGARRAVVTDGARLAADAALGQPTLTVQPPRVTIARVTGAGDALLAAHLAAEMAGFSRQAALEHAVSTAARHVAGHDPGPLAPSPAPEEVYETDARVFPRGAHRA